MRRSFGERRAPAALGLVIAFMAIGGLAAGCGDDDDDDDAPALTEEEFLAQGNEICRAGNEEIKTAFESLDVPQGEEPTEAQIVQTLEEVAIPNTRVQIEAIDALTPPAELQDEVDEVIADARAALDEMSADPAVVLEGTDPFAQVNRRLGQLGLTECAG